ncbi:MAG: hypothetical protein WEC84_03675 [Candidatus Andersenbacteria bacterium]
MNEKKCPVYVVLSTEPGEQEEEIVLPERFADRITEIFRSGREETGDRRDTGQFPSEES